MPGTRAISTFQIDDPNILKYIPRPLWPSFRSADRKSWVPTELGTGLTSGASNLAELFQNPGGLSSNVSRAIAPRLAMEATQIAANQRNQMSEAKGRAARSGIGGGKFAQALESAIQNAGARNMATARQGAMLQSEQMRRQDLDSMLQYVQMLINGTLQGRNIQLGKSAQALDAQKAKSQEKSAELAAYASLIAAFA